MCQFFLSYNTLTPSNSKFHGSIKTNEICLPLQTIFPSVPITCLDNVKTLKVPLTHHVAGKRVSGQQVWITKNMVSKGLGNGDNKSFCSRKRMIGLQMTVYIAVRL